MKLKICSTLQYSVHAIVCPKLKPCCSDVVVFVRYHSKCWFFFVYWLFMSWFMQKELNFIFFLGKTTIDRKIDKPPSICHFNAYNKLLLFIGFDYCIRLNVILLYWVYSGEFSKWFWFYVTVITGCPKSLFDLKSTSNY